MASASLLAVTGLTLTCLVGALDQEGQAAARTASAAPPARSAFATGVKSRQSTQLHRLVRELVAAGAPGVIVRVDDGQGRPLEIAEQAPWTRKDHRLRAEDEFRMGSNTKTMMATLVLQLVGQGKLALADPVDTWLPGQVPNGRAITLRMLLNHTSGLFDYTEDPAVLPSAMGKDQRRWTSEQLLALGVRHDPLFAPGTRWAYSNTDYAAIGAVLEKATGRSLADLVRDRIARPLHLEHTYYATDSTWHGPHARGYEPDAAHMPPGVPAEFRDFAGVHRGGHVDVSHNNPSWGGAAGAVVSTAQDWGRFHAALMSGRLLPAAQLAQMRTTVPIFPDRPDGPGYGLGIETAATPCGTVWAHDGGIPGYLSTSVTDSTGRRTATVLVATEAFAEHPDAFPELATAAKTLQTAAMCALFDKPAPIAEPIS
ncbi:serine hydrolase domain-containing protein [Streptomyces sp. BPTC-684]|uniref:serine hydrolase domain-containing protein n=1 Tax=Streptomyces sp. BPTC-684 TaxID=3043734 RepID=UPI0024B2639B|nr:serine hydrolase domain-containing protein [Streptomyces sp. BPTC-684]WHM40712.1 serine hydrolase domain-containing protein [Streptomyces sp. BPTC-684]